MEQLIGVGFGVWMVIGLFLDGWAHDNNQPETFFTPWHGVLYTGFMAASAAAIIVAWRSRGPHRPWTQTLPLGHDLTLIALGVFAMGAVGDLIWHETLGIEVGVEALLSPTHLLLLIGGVVALSAPVRTAWTTPGDEPNLRTIAPTVLSVALLTALVGFFLMYLSPFVNDAAGSGFERISGAPHDHPASDPAELRQLLGLASILMTTVLYSVGAYVIARRWRLPMWSYTILFGTVTMLFVGLNGFAEPWLVLAGLAAGMTSDAVGQRAQPILAVSAGIAVLWAAYFVIYELTAGGVAWTAPLWTGSIVLSAMIAAAIGLVATPLKRWAIEPRGSRDVEGVPATRSAAKGPNAFPMSLG